jgi:LacI family transcriptional regulator
MAGWRGRLAVARSRGLSVPGDLTVVGFDDMPIARDVTPALTTIHLPLVAMGERAMVLALSTSDSSGARIETAPSTLVIRDSDGPPR